jgi:integrase
MMELNNEARRAIFLIADTGLRISEAVNLNETTIHLDCDIPHVRVLPDGRRVKTADSIREIPLVGTALAAMKLHPNGFPRYVDKGASFSGYVNGFLLEKGLRPTRKHTAYSLRHTFKDRLIAARAQDSMIEALMGHSDDHPKYGSGPALDLKFEVLHRIAFTPPATL